MATVLESLDPSVAPGSPERYTCRTVDGIAAIAGLEAKWPSSSTGAEWGGPMASFGWSLAAASALAGEQSPRLVIAADGDGTLQAVAPLARTGRAGSGRLEILGLRRLNEPADFVFNNRKALAALIDGMLRLRRPILLGRMPAESPTIELLRQACRGRAVVVVRPQASCPFIPLDETWSKPESHLSSRRRSDYRRALRRAERRGEVRAEVIAPAPEQLDGSAANRVRHRSPLVERGCGNGASLRSGAGRPFATIRPLGLSGRHAANRPAFSRRRADRDANCHGRGRAMVAAQDRLRPGLVGLLARHAVAVRDAASCGSATTDVLTNFSAPSKPGRKCGRCHERECVSVRVYPFGLHGAAALAADGIEIAGRKVKSRLPIVA